MGLSSSLRSLQLLMGSFAIILQMTGLATILLEFNDWFFSCGFLSGLLLLTTAVWDNCSKTTKNGGLDGVGVFLLIISAIASASAVSVSIINMQHIVPNYVDTEWLSTSIHVLEIATATCAVACALTLLIFKVCFYLRSLLTIQLAHHHMATMEEVCMMEDVACPDSPPPNYRGDMCDTNEACDVTDEEQQADRPASVNLTNENTGGEENADPSQSTSA